MKQIPYESRTDAVQDKLRLLKAAYQVGDLDLAMSLAEATKDTLAFERQQHGKAARPTSPDDHIVPIDELPKAWASWAEGWKYCKPLDLFETVDIGRFGEPVDVAVAFRADEVTDPGREVRVARLDEKSATLREVPSQVYDERRAGDQRSCRLVILADIAAHRQATYLVFYGNPLAERPEYTSDLIIRGEGYALDIENHHYTARLSRQVGQLESITYKRQHGLELYAGGKGHGEPPGIDWAHDYVDEGHFQKLRMRNWPQCPNYQVIRGPLVARVRRWGFPYSPIHPLFTPSRVHMDQTYTFYAGLPYFFKEGEIRVIKDVNVAAMRDDEWVFSGYSFTDSLWFDHQGRLHEGSVPATSARNLWGVGFYHRDSHDAFIAMWLKHDADGFAGLSHGGAPTLNYHGHGQLWSRYPVDGAAKLKAGTSIRQKNAYLVAAYAGRGDAPKVERLRHQLENPLEVHPAGRPRADNAAAVGTLAKAGERQATAQLKSAIWNELRGVRDEQLYNIDGNIVDMGYVYDVRVSGGNVTVLVTMPHRGRPEYNFLVTAGGGRVEPGIRDRLSKLDGVRDVVVQLTWNPPWTADRLTDAARQALGLPA